MISDPKIIGLALLGGVAPALIWLWFWLREDEERPEPKGLILMCFLLGMAAVIFILPVEKLIQTAISSQVWQIVSWAGAEEIIKYLAVIVLLSKLNRIKYPIDWPIYLITASLGFAAMENTFFLLKPLSLDHSTVSILTSQLRFLGSTLLHAVSSGLIGICLGLSFYMRKIDRKFYLLIGLSMAIALHSSFNFFIMDRGGNNFLSVFGFLWVVTIINLLLLEKLRRMSGEN